MIQDPYVPNYTIFEKGPLQMLHRFFNTPLNFFFYIR